jgi:hypothetical protein
MSPQDQAEGFTHDQYYWALEFLKNNTLTGNRWDVAEIVALAQVLATNYQTACLQHVETAPEPDFQDMLDQVIKEGDDQTFIDIAQALGFYFVAHPEGLEDFQYQLTEAIRYFSSPEEMAADMNGQSWPPLAA